MSKFKSFFNISKEEMIYFFITFFIGVPLMIIIMVIFNNLFTILEVNSFLETKYGFISLILLSFTLSIKITKNLTDELMRYINNL